MKVNIKDAQKRAENLLKAIQELTTLIPKVNKKLVELERRVAELEKKTARGELIPSLNKTLELYKTFICDNSERIMK